MFCSTQKPGKEIRRYTSPPTMSKDLNWNLMSLLSWPLEETESHHEQRALPLLYSTLRKTYVRVEGGISPERLSDMKLESSAKKPKENLRDSSLRSSVMVEIQSISL